MTLAEDIQNAIRAVELPGELIRRLDDSFSLLGSDVAVRSSATCEDGQQHSAAGLGYTALHQTTRDSVVASVREVWASLYSPTFIAYRDEIGYPDGRAQMAVLLQAFVDARVAGVVNSFDQGTGRPGYCISAQPGLGEGVVKAIGEVDHWFVGFWCEETDILERKIPTKDRRFVVCPEGGTVDERIWETGPCLDDRMILRVARVAKAIRQRYSRLKVAEDVDIEYALDKNGQLFVVQARPKWQQKIADSDGKLVVKTTAVDAVQLHPLTTAVRLSEASMIAVDGAVTAKLCVDRGGGAAGCLPGRVIVAHHTNNEYNARFGSFAAVITSDGDPTSHAAQHAYEKRIPCVVGAIGVVEARSLRWPGCHIRCRTQDRLPRSRSRYRTGIEPGRVVDHPGADSQLGRRRYGTMIDEGTRHEVFRAWPVSKRKRPAVFREDFEGHYRLRSSTYRFFELSYYYHAWDRLTQYLTSMFGHRTDRILKTQARQIKAVRAGRCLVHEVTDNDPESIYYYLMSVNGFGIADLERLFDARLDGFRTFAAFVHGLRSINVSNVEQVVEELINVFTWMHFGFWLDCVVEDIAQRQLRYIRNDGSFHNVLRDEAVADPDKDYRVDPQSSWIPPGKILYLSRQRDKAMFALLERIRGNPDLRAAFAAERPSEVCKVLAERFPSDFQVISGWSMRYKLTREDLDLPSDTEEYLSLLRKMLDEDSTMPVSLLSVVYQEHLRTHDALGQDAPTILRDMCRRDEQLYLLCRAHTRAEVARDCRIPISDVNDADLAARMPYAVAALHNDAMNDMRFRQIARAQVLDSNYPNLKAMLRVSRLQVVLREDGHHLIVPHQRTIARMMRGAAKAFVPQYLNTPDDVFDISTDEFIALFHEPDPRFITLSLERRRKLLEAERETQKVLERVQTGLPGSHPGR